MNTAWDYSVNETASRARLAAKGIGYSWGMADEVSRSVFWLSQRQVPAMALLADLFSQLKTPQGVAMATPQKTGGELISNDHYLCPIISGCALSDGYQSISEHQLLTIKNIRYPFLIVPFVAQLAQRCEKTLVLEIHENTIATDGAHFVCSAQTLLSLDLAEALVCRVANGIESDFSQSSLVDTQSRVAVEDRHWQALGEYAKKTYAPATESSRLSGAGAGVTDND